MRSRSALTIAAAAAITLLGMTPLAAQTLVKVATFVPERSTGVSGVIKPWMKAVEAEVGAAVKMKGFWGGTLGKSPLKQFELVRNGVADVTWVLPSYTAGQFPEMGIMELPFLFKNAEEASIVGWKLHEKGLFSGLQDVHLVGFFTTEPNALFMRGSLGTLENLKNKKIRSVGPIPGHWLETIGATPEAISSAEMNEALQRGTLDGAVQGWTGMKTFKALQLVDEATDVPVGVISFLLVMNKGTWERLTPDAQAAVMKHGAMAMAKRGGKVYSEAGRKIVDAVRAEGRIKIVVPDAAAMKEYADQALKTHRWWIEKTANGQAVYDAAQAILAEIRR